MPQLNPEYLFSQLFWLLVSISILYAVFSLFFYPRLLRIMKMRSRKAALLQSKLDVLLEQVAILNKQKSILISQTDERLARIEIEASTYLSELRSEVYKKLDKIEFISRVSISKSITKEFEEVNSRIEVIVACAAAIINNATNLDSVNKEEMRKLCYKLL